MNMEGDTGDENRSTSEEIKQTQAQGLTAARFLLPELDAREIASEQRDDSVRTTSSDLLNL